MGARSAERLNSMLVTEEKYFFDYLCVSKCCMCRFWLLLKLLLFSVSGLLLKLLLFSVFLHLRCVHACASYMLLRLIETFEHFVVEDVVIVLCDFIYKICQCFS